MAAKTEEELSWNSAYATGNHVNSFIWGLWYPFRFAGRDSFHYQAQIRTDSEVPGGV